MKNLQMQYKPALLLYLADYVNEELRRGAAITDNTMLNAFDAFEAGAHGIEAELTILIEG